MNGYSLYVDKPKLILLIEPNKTLLTNATDEVKRFNDYYYVCSDRKKLAKKAKELKEQWLREAIDRLNQVENLKIKNKYK